MRQDVQKCRAAPVSPLVRSKATIRRGDWRDQALACGRSTRATDQDLSVPNCAGGPIRDGGTRCESRPFARRPASFSRSALLRRERTRRAHSRGFAILGGSDALRSLEHRPSAIDVDYPSIPWPAADLSDAWMVALATGFSWPASVRPTGISRYGWLVRMSVSGPHSCVGA